MSATATHIEKKKILAPKLRFKEFNGNWNSIIVGDHIISSAFGPRFSSDLYSDSGNVLTLRTTDMDNDGNICYDKVPLAILNLDELKEHILLKDDLVISRSGTIGITGIFRGHSTPVIPGAFLIRFRFKKDELSPDFVRLYFNCSKGRNEIESLSAGGVQKNLTGSSVLKMSLIVPNFPEQQKIASFLSAVDEKIQQLTRKKELLEQFKKGVMQQLFSGKLRFKDENGKAFPKWEEKRLGDVGEIVSGLTYSPVDVNNEGVLVLRSSNVQDRQLSFEDNVYVKVKTGSFNPVKENDILICVRNGSRNLIGKNTIIDKKNEGVAFGAFMTVYRSDFNLFFSSVSFKLKDFQLII